MFIIMSFIINAIIAALYFVYILYADNYIILLEYSHFHETESDS